MMNSVAAVTAAALCAGASVGLFPISTTTTPGALPAVIAPATVSAAAAETQHQPTLDRPCTQGWPYYPAECLRGDRRSEAVRVIPLAGTGKGRVVQHRS
jgi:hypothetical protein